MESRWGGVEVSMIGKSARFILDTLFPIECLGCKKEGTWACLRCLKRIPIQTEDCCLVCKLPVKRGKTCFACRKIFTLEGVFSFLDYDYGLVKSILKAAKYGYVRGALDPLIRIVEDYFLSKLEFLDADPRALIFVPVPLHPRRLRDRGFNQAEIIARRFAAISGGQSVPALVRRRHRPPQASLDEIDRARNIRHNIWCVEPEAIRGKFVCVVDDVATTGSTLGECGRALRQARASEVWGMVLAKG
ncbi:ComF family protein [Candidatus Uhrbacteria bacterium]|nr:ComF family protein [Candidatus Uhrbacteria bacterium]